MSAERVVVEGLDGNGRAQWRERLALGAGRRTFTIGRSVDADVTLDDPHAAALHAFVEITEDGRLLASDLGSVNGLIVGGKRWCNAKGLQLADGTLQIGGTQLRVRTGREPLEPERPYRLQTSPLARAPGLIATLAALASALQLTYGVWLGAPHDFAVGIVSRLSVVAPLAAGWIGVWGLLSRVMQGEWRWLRHTAICLGVTAAFVAVTGILDLGTFVLGLPVSSSSYTWLGAAALAGALFLHLRHASPLPAGRAALVACGIPVVLAAGSLWVQQRYLVGNVNYIAARMRIYPPALRLYPAEKLDSYFDRAAGLRERASKRLADAIANEPGKDDDDN
jgi:hypothetical protein